MRSGRPHTRSLALAAVRARMSAGTGGCAVREELERRAALPALQAPVCATFAPRISVYCNWTLSNEVPLVRIAVAPIAVENMTVLLL